MRALFHHANAFFGCHSNGVNAFFIRKDKKPAQVREFSPKDGYVAGQINEVFNKLGQMVKIPFEEQQRLVLILPLVDIRGDTKVLESCN